jgi:hypothetical protein
MESSDELVSGAASWCLAKKGDRLVVYAPKGGKVVVDLRGMSESLHTLEWFDPRTGRSRFGTALQGGAKVTLDPPAPFDTEFAAYIYIAGDQTPPTAPTDLGLEAQGERKIMVTWKPANDVDSGIGAYNIYRDENLAGSADPDELIYIDTNVRPSTTYQYSVTAINVSGIEGPAVGPKTVETWEDATDPELVDINVLTSRSIQLVFSEEIQEESAENIENYSITPDITVQRARLLADLKSVRLTTSSYEEGITYTVTAGNITDLAGRLISPAANSLTFKMVSDQMWFFAEDAKRANGAALKVIDGTLGTRAAYCPNGSSTLTFKVNIDNEGEWYAWGRFMFIGSGNDPNSFFLRIDDGDQKKFGNNKDFFNKWHWDGDGNVENGATQALDLGSLSPGEHTITLTCREPLGNPGTENILIDMLYLTMQADIKPTDEVAPTRTAVNSGSEKYPEKFVLNNYPNPFNPKTNIRFTLPAESQVTIDVFDILGKRIRSLADHKLLGYGDHTLLFDGSELSSGVYFCTLQTESAFWMNKMLLVK